jgi:aspartokinase-like uncharacterized kinase
MPVNAPDGADGVSHDAPVVIKVGGGLLATPGALDRVCAALGRLIGLAKVIVIPGGGPFADAVRAADHAHAPGDDAVHWMAVLAMDQYAHLLASRVRGARLVDTPEAARVALRAGAIPVLAPYRWLREADPLPHTWSVTSDSIAAWYAGELGARMLVLLKPVEDDIDRLVDPSFAHVLRAGVETAIVGAAGVQRLESLLSNGAPAAR